MYSYSYYEISDNNQTFFSEKHMNLWWPQTFYQAKACNRQTGNYMKEDIMRAGSRAWSRCMLNWDVYWAADWSADVARRVPVVQFSVEQRGETSPLWRGTEMGLNVVETKTLIHLSNSSFSVFSSTPPFSLCSGFCLQYASGLHSK